MVKDCIGVKDAPLSFGLAEPIVDTSPAHAVIVSKLIEAGATLLASTNLDPWGLSSYGENEHYGNIKNPLFPEKIAGGSSGGSAAAITQVGEVFKAWTIKRR